MLYFDSDLCVGLKKKKKEFVWCLDKYRNILRFNFKCGATRNSVL